MIFSSGAPSAKLASVPHVRQMASWDCGLACISMILLALGMEHSLLGLGEDVASESVWTIDMAYLLQKFGVKDFTYYTSYIGVNWQYVTKDFYRDTLEQDRRRVHSLFAAARENQVRVICLTLALDDIRRFLLSTVYAVVVLVDLRMVRCKTCRRGSWGKWRWPWRRVVSMGETAGAEFHDQPPVSVTTTNSIYGSTRHDFIGHYIVLIGYDVDEDRFYYRDPGTEAELCCMDADDFERARGGCGTDYDVIVSRVR
ncbi:Guanylylate cyclase-domain-containing protein [Phlyctochytrium arcticum]|nr:Guanylylate cyclase-domain-containing protein [Phlyctochytrium arcticum]